uniref:Uncharacterized protein ycf45 n=1 Tax=Paulinella chromatophora TaxID=39717 RepID=B1X511_PAUCH|nr:hypothetical protein PCC_0600 [Paulinella chromatophora]ACB43030.1 hypothetical protein PCC_0600 [Paulinella chromatophora]
MSLPLKDVKSSPLQIIISELNHLLNILPARVYQALSNQQKMEELLEIILDLGKIPIAHYRNNSLLLGDKPITRIDLERITERLGSFGEDNRVGIDSTLHRISALRNRKGTIIGLTCRVGRAICGDIIMIRDLLDSGQSILIMGCPGIGKTTALREIARLLADDLNRRVIIIDTSNEIAGDSDIPHPSIGKARRMQVANPNLQHRMMIEAIENHTPEVIVIDEIGTEMEAQAARTIAERGIQLIATAHGDGLASLVKNPTLSDLVGGIQSVILGDDEAQRRCTQKTVLERAADPTFPVAIEMHTSHRWSIHADVAHMVDIILRNWNSSSSLSRDYLSNKGLPIGSKTDKSSLLVANNLTNSLSTNFWKNSRSRTEDLNPNMKYDSTDMLVLPELIRIFCCGITCKLLNELILIYKWPLRLIDNVRSADIILSVPKYLSHNTLIRRHAQNHRIPILIIKSETVADIRQAIERVLSTYMN